MRRLWAAIGGGLAALILGSGQASLSATTITPELRARILAHGPWPLPPAPDRSNRVSGDPEAIRLGRALFFDEGLSRFGALSCASCHKPDLAWTDWRAKASAAAALDRNTPTLHNLRHMRWLGWDGAADSLWMQSLRPILDAREMAASPEHVRDRIARMPALEGAYRRVFGAPAHRQPAARALVNAAKSLAAFQETLETPPTPFDRFREALARGDAAAQDRYPESARRGLALFVGRARCSSCHAGPLFTDHTFHATGPPPPGPASRPDAGRADGLRKLAASPYTRLGRFSDQRHGAAASRTRAALAGGGSSQVNAFRVPSLRNVARTAPYMHDGSRSTLADAVRHYTMLDEARAKVARIPLTEGEIAGLVAFLESLSDSP